MKKKIITVISALLIICAAAAVLIGTQKNHEPSLEEIVSDKLTAYEIDLLDSVSTMETNKDIADYLVDWGENKGIDTLCDSSGNVIFSIEAAEGYENAPPYVILCGYDAENLSSCINNMSAALTAAKNPQNNCSFKVIFTPQNDGDLAGAENLSANFFTQNSEVIVLEGSDKPFLSDSAAGYRSIELYDSLDYRKPEYESAYRISIDNISAADNYTDDVPNPVKILGTLLAEFKSTSVLFELAEFDGGSAAETAPASAQMTVVVNGSSEKKFIKRVNSFIGKFNNKYLETFPEITFTCEEAELPEKVISPADTDDIVSLLYTAIDGVYYKDDSGSVTAACNIGKIRTGKNIRIGIFSYSCDPVLLDEIYESYIIISGLCDVKYRINEENLPLQPNAASGALAEKIRKVYSDYSRDQLRLLPTAHYTASSVIARKCPDIAVILCGVSEDSRYNYACTLISLLDQSTAAE